jgi:hypothetical protein
METLMDLTFRIYDEAGDVVGAAAHAEDAAQMMSGYPGGTIRVRRKIVWREHDGADDERDGEACDSYDHVRTVIWTRMGWEAR